MSMWLQIVLYAVAGCGGIALLIALFRSGKPLRRLCGGALQGVCALAAVNLAGVFTGVSLGINWFTLGVCGTLGIPGVITLLLLKLIFPL